MILPDALYRSAQVREMEARITADGISATELMARAGAAALSLLRTRWPRARRVVVVCGPGNNGGDGYVLARRAHEAGMEVALAAVGRSGEAGPARAARSACEQRGMRVEDWQTVDVGNADVVVDALFGIGLDRAVRDDARTAIEAINAARVPVLAIDVPSGLNADTGAVMGAVVDAAATITFLGLKLGLCTGAGRAHAGDIYFDDLGVPAATRSALAASARRLTAARLRGLVRPRRADAHKGDFGRVLVIGGAPGMAGATRLAGEAAYRVGAGLVTVATHPSHASALNSTCRELIVHGVDDALGLRPLLRRADVVALGPGLGLSAWSQSMFTAVMETDKPLVVDADALNLLAHEPERRDNTVLTPHPGEAGRLLATSSSAIQADRFAALDALTERYGGVVVLKGSGALIGGAGVSPVELCDAGNPGMASAGMGDVLTGVIAGLAAQGLAPADAARVGVWLHARAGDALAAASQAGLMASDLYPHLRSELEALTDAIA